MPKTQVCTKCKQEKPLSQFYKNKNSKNGVKARCKECIANSKPLKNPFKRLSIEDEKEANMKAIKKLVAKHPSQYLSLLDEERTIIARKRST